MCSLSPWLAYLAYYLCLDTKPKAQQNNMYKSYNVDKSDESGPEMKWREVLNQVADKDLWDGVKREQRPEWQDYLNKADALARKPRKPIPQVRPKHNGKQCRPCI